MMYCRQGARGPALGFRSGGNQVDDDRRAGETTTWDVSDLGGWTLTQKQRLKRLNADAEILNQDFNDPGARDEAFYVTEKSLVKREKERLRVLRDVFRRPGLCLLEESLTKALVDAGFVQVITPMLISEAALQRMSIRGDHPLRRQVFWVDHRRCLRPMLAPNLYVMLRSLDRLWDKPVRIFEIGPCFRRDSRGRSHLDEFTMLNLVEMDRAYSDPQGRLEELIQLVLHTAGIAKYDLYVKKSEVYGETIDIMTGIEVGSAVIGPNPLDHRWGITDPWIGIGFGVERLLITREGYDSIARVGRSVTYLDGVLLNI